MESSILTSSTPNQILLDDLNVNELENMSFSLSRIEAGLCW